MRNDFNAYEVIGEKPNQEFRLLADNAEFDKLAKSGVRVNAWPIDALAKSILMTYALQNNLPVSDASKNPSKESGEVFDFLAFNSTENVPKCSSQGLIK